MCRRTKEEVVPTVGLPRYRHFAGFFNVPVLAPTRDHPFLYGDSDTPPHLVAFYDHAVDTEDTSRLNPRPSWGSSEVECMGLTFLICVRFCVKRKLKYPFYILCMHSKISCDGAIS